MEEYFDASEPKESSENDRNQNPPLVVLPNPDAQLTDVSEQDEPHSAVSDDGHNPPPPIHENLDLEPRCHRVRLCRHRAESDESSRVESEEEIERRKQGMLQRLNEAYRQLDELRAQLSNSQWNQQAASEVQSVGSSSSERRNDRYTGVSEPSHHEQQHRNAHASGSKRNIIDRETAFRIRRVHCIMEDRLREMEERLRRLENLHQRKRPVSPNQIIYESRSFREQTNLYNFRDYVPYRRQSKDHFVDYIPSRDQLLHGRSSRDVLLDPASSMNLALNQRSLSYLDSEYRNPRDYPYSEPRALLEKPVRLEMSRDELDSPSTSRGETGRKSNPRRRVSPRRVSISHRSTTPQGNMKRSMKGSPVGTKLVKCETSIRSPTRSPALGETSVQRPRSPAVTQRSARAQKSSMTLAKFFDMIFSMGGRNPNARKPTTPKRTTRSSPPSIQSRSPPPSPNTYSRAPAIRERTARRDSSSLTSPPSRPSQWQLLWEMTTAVEDMTRRLLESRQRRHSSATQTNQVRPRRNSRAGGSTERYPAIENRTRQLPWESTEVPDNSTRRHNRQTGGACRFDLIYFID